MADTRRKNGTNTSRNKKKNTSSRNSRSGRGSRRSREDGPDFLTIAIIAVGLIFCIILLVNWKREQDLQKKSDPTPLPAPTAATQPKDEKKNPSKDIQVTPATEPTKPLTAELTPTPVPIEATPFPTEEIKLSASQATEIVNAHIDTTLFFAELVDDDLQLEGAGYYFFVVNNGEGTIVEPLLVVNRKSGEMFCYNPEGGELLTPFVKFPLDPITDGQDERKEITAAEAEQILMRLTSVQLGLDKELSAYTLETDEWPTTAKGCVCYGINILEEDNGKQRYRGTFYVPYDGNRIFGRNQETDDFYEILQ